jgi:hypothetical protein
VGESISARPLIVAINRTMRELMKIRTSGNTDLESTCRGKVVYAELCPALQIDAEIKCYRYTEFWSLKLLNS